MRKSWISQSLDIKRFLQYLTNIPEGSANHPPYVEHSRRVYILFSISIIGTIVIFLFGVIALIKKSYSLGMLDFTLAFALAVNLLHARRYRNYNTNIYFGITLSAIFFVYIFLTGGINTTGFVCYYIFPLIASFLLGSKKGAIATVLISLPVIILFLMKTPPSIFTNYDFDFKLRFLSSFLVVSVFSYLFEYSREQNQEELQRAHDDLEKRVDERTSALQEAIQSLQNEISERRRAEEALRESEERYRTILESIQEGYFEIDLKGDYTFVNDANCRFLGYTKEELVGMNYRQHSDEKTAKELYTHYYELYQKGKPIEALDVEVIRKDGTKTIYETSVSLIRDPDGKPIGFRGVSRDITERRQAEEVLRESERGLRIIFESMQAGVLIIDPETHVIVDLNPAALKLMGGPKEKIVDSICHKHICPAEIGKCPITDLKQNVENAERVLLTANGESRQIIKTVVPILLGGRRYLLESFVDISERKRAEELLRESEEKYRTILEDTQEGYFEIDLAGNLTFVNEEVCRRLGYSREELIGMNYRRYTDPKTTKQVYQAYNELYRTGEPIRGLDGKVIRKNGTELIHEVSASLIRDSEGKPIGFRGTSRDITERKRMEEALRESEERYRTILESIEDGYYETDLAGNLTFFNDSMCQISKIPEEEMIGLNNRQYMDHENADKVFQAFNQVYRTGQPRREFEWKINRKDGSKAYVEASISLRKDASGKPIGFRGIVRDITERKQTEELLRESEAQSQQLFDEAPVGYHVYDIQGRITKVNHTELEMLGYKPEEVLGQPVWKFAGDEETSRHGVLAKIAGTTPPGHSFERIYRRKDGTTLTVIVEDRLLRDSEGRITGIRSTIQDITERKQMEEALRESENKFRDLAEKSLIGVYLIQDSVFKYVNARFAEINGYTAEELIDKKGPKDLVFPEDRPMVEENARKRLSGDVGSFHFELRGITKDNRIINIEAYDSVTVYQGRPAVVGTLLDITDRKRAEEKLRESEERFRQLAENIREVFYISEEGTTRYVSPGYLEIWGRSPQHLYEETKSILDTVHPEDRDRVLKSLRLKNQEEVEEVYRIVRPDGSIRWIKDRSFPIYDDTGKTHRIVGIAADITDLKLGEEKLKYLSLHDSLTGLYNRIYFEEEISRIEKGRHDTVGILSCDVDGLKLVNDTLGHDQGDRLLIAAARVIRECFREGDLVARIGGDEFSVLLPDTTESAAENACDRIQEAVASYNATNPQLPLSISVGFAINDGGYQSLKDLFKEADNHMYQKKLYGTKSVRSAIVKTLINTLKARDHTAESHIIRLEKLLAGIAASMGLPESTRSDLSLLAKFHDIGKVGIADAILFKEAPLTPEEWTEMKRHCEIGYRIALSAPELVPIADWILKHHEWWNGQGYPLCIEGEEIPIECRLLAIADTYESLTSVCPYQKTYSHSEAVAELRRYSGKQFDPKLLEKFLQLLETQSLASQLNVTTI